MNPMAKSVYEKNLTVEDMENMQKSPAEELVSLMAAQRLNGQNPFKRPDLLNYHDFSQRTDRNELNKEKDQQLFNKKMAHEEFDKYLNKENEKEIEPLLGYKLVISEEKQGDLEGFLLNEKEVKEPVISVYDIDKSKLGVTIPVSDFQEKYGVDALLRGLENGDISISYSSMPEVSFKTMHERDEGPSTSYAGIVSEENYSRGSIEKDEQAKFFHRSEYDLDEPAIALERDKREEAELLDSKFIEPGVSEKEEEADSYYREWDDSLGWEPADGPISETNWV